MQVAITAVDAVIDVARVLVVETEVERAVAGLEAVKTGEYLVLLGSHRRGSGRAGKVRRGLPGNTQCEERRTSFCHR
jgi:hypothetical protein